MHIQASRLSVTVLAIAINLFYSSTEAALPPLSTCSAKCFDPDAFGFCSNGVDCPPCRKVNPITKIASCNAFSKKGGTSCASDERDCSNFQDDDISTSIPVRTTKPIKTTIAPTSTSAPSTTSAPTTERPTTTSAPTSTTAPTTASKTITPKSSETPESDSDGTGSPTTSNTQNAAASNEKRGIPMMTIIGVALICLVAAGIIVAAAFYFYKKRNQPDEDDLGTPRESTTQYKALPVAKLQSSFSRQSQELPSRAVYAQPEPYSAVSSGPFQPPTPELVPPIAVSTLLQRQNSYGRALPESRVNNSLIGSGASFNIQRSPSTGPEVVPRPMPNPPSQLPRALSQGQSFSETSPTGPVSPYVSGGLHPGTPDNSSNPGHIYIPIRASAGVMGQNGIEKKPLSPIPQSMDANNFLRIEDSLISRPSIEL